MNKNKFIYSLLISTLVSCVSCGSSSTSQESTVKPLTGEPEIRFFGETNVIGGRSDKSVSLPKYALYGSNGEILGNNCLTIEHYIDGELDSEKGYIPGETAGYYEGGSHTFDFKLVEPSTNKVVEEQVTLELYQRILGEGGDTISDLTKGYGLQNESTKPYYRTTNEGWAVRPFYMERGYQYYAECIFPGFDGTYRSLGMLHSDKLDINTGNFYRDEVWGNPQDNTFGYCSGFMWQNLINNDSSWFLQGPNPILKKALSFGKDTSIKCACARNGDDFYFFVNDKLVTKHTIDIFKNRGTIPGFVLGSYHMDINKNRANSHDIDSISFCSGVRAINKIDSLINGVKTFDYLRYDEDANYEYAKFNNDNSINGMGFKYTDLALSHTEKFWDDSVFPKVRFWGDFKVEFDYELTGVGTDWGNMRIAFADSREGSNGSKTELFNLHSGLFLFYNTSLSTQQNTYLSKGGWELNTDNGFNYQSLKLTLGLKDSVKDKFHISITKKENFLNNSEIFTYVFSKNNKSYTVESVVNDVVINGVHLLDSIRPLYMYFTVDRMAYSISNFQYESLNVFE